jgi:hypothetical protein
MRKSRYFSQLCLQSRYHSNHSDTNMRTLDLCFLILFENTKLVVKLLKQNFRIGKETIFRMCGCKYYVFVCKECVTYRQELKQR